MVGVSGLIPIQLLFLLRIDDKHWDRIHSSLTTIHCFDNGCVGKQPVVWKEYCAEYWLKELQESMDRCTGHCDVTENNVENGIKHHTINQSVHLLLFRQRQPQ